MERQITLGDVIAPAKVLRCDNDDYSVLSMTMHDGIVLQSNRFKKSLVSIDQSNYKVVLRGQLVVGFPIDEGVIYVQNIAEAGIMSPAYGVWNIHSKEILPEYLELCLHSPQSMDYYKNKLRGTTARRRSITTGDLLALPIILPSLTEQKRRIGLFRQTTLLLNSQKQTMLKFDELVKSRFVEMFGDTLLNTKEWTENCLETLADIVSGITKGRKVKEGSLVEVPYMAVSNVKDGHIDWTTVKTIMATRQEINQYRLQSDDVLMTEGGDPDKVGRGAIIKNPPINCIHQNHIFRVRLDEGNILPTYFAEYLQHQKAKRYFLGCAKQTTGIASINMRQLKSLPVLLPPLELQNRFAAFVAEVDKSKLAVKQSLEKLETLKKSLMQQYFG